MILIIFVIVMLCLIGLLAPMVAMSNKKHLMMMIKTESDYRIARHKGENPDPYRMIMDLADLKGKIVGDKNAIKKADDIYQRALTLASEI